MKTMKKFFALLIAMAMVLGMSTTVFAAGTGTITINVPDNTTTKTTYSVYKVFDATVNASDSTKVSYKLPSGKTLTTAMETYFEVDTAGNIKVKDAAKDSQGNLTAGAITAIAAFVAGDQPVATVEAAVGAETVTTEALAYGFYYISTTTGSVVTIDTNNDNPTVDDKNTLSVVVKSPGTEYDEDSLKAIAQVGTEQDFTAQITVGKGATKLVFVDTMTDMTYVAGSLAVKNGNTPLVAGTDYTLEVSDDKATFTVTFLDVATKLKEKDKITLNYKGLVTSDALSVNPATNKATLTTDNENTSESETSEIYNAKFTVTKVDDKNNPLEGAGFVLKNAAGKYYKIDNNVVSWVDSESDATEYKTTTASNVVVFTGLADGTYTLHEKTVPEGYNQAADSTFTVAGNNYTAGNLEQTATVTNEAGTELPSTGGMGTTILYIIGGALVVVCGIMLVAKKRTSNK